MKFKINGSEWNIEVVSEDKMNNTEKNNDTFGVTMFRTNTIWIVEGLADSLKTLKHELMHVWLWEYGHNQHNKNAFDCEDVCKIVACSNAFINEVVEKFKQTMKNI